MAYPSIRLLEPDPQRRGDLFGRAMMDLFHALGYHQFTANIPRTGREVDLKAAHRTADHEAVAECKATAEPIGGDDLNKFAGALEVERQRSDRHIDGYFVSLNGFRSSALAQEKELKTSRLALLDGQDVVRELIAGKIVVTPEAAAATAGKCTPQPLRAAAEPHIELLSHQSGWYWGVTFSVDGAATAVALVHADGAALSYTAALPIVEADSAAGGVLATLDLLVPQTAARASLDAQTAALTAYSEYLSREYGRITVDGLPADEHVESRGILLGDLYVPMHLQPLALMQSQQESTDVTPDLSEDELEIEPLYMDDDQVEDSSTSGNREPIGKILADRRRIAVLGPPGSGKSTLLKRIAVAYGVPSDPHDIGDELPHRNWLPLVVRCRQLTAQDIGSVYTVVDEIASRAEIPEHRDAFRAVANAALRDGSALVLIDGLDEIADPQTRLTFVKQLRTFIGTYPNIQLVVTSREAGFRVVAGALYDVCASYRVSDFDTDDIEQLTLAWSKLVDGDSPKASAEARNTARAIIRTDRVQRLARNPLLLTTLLLVRRWIGELPKKRTVLYGKAIEVLLMTWNVEAHEPIDLDDARPQLAYVAFAMTRDATQVLTRPELIALLEEARREMPEVLGHSDLTPGQFLERIEERSSLLSLSGHAVADGTLVPLYEFKHLTFQEYLTAVAISEGFYPGRDNDDKVEQLIVPRVSEVQWREVIPMAAVLVGRKAPLIIDALIQATEPTKEGQLDAPALSLLAQCIADEVQMPPETVERTVKSLGKAYFEKGVPRGDLLGDDLLRGILASKYRDSFSDALARGLFRSQSEFWMYGSMLAGMATRRYLWDADDRLQKAWLGKLEVLLGTDATPRQHAEGALSVMIVAFHSRERRRAMGRGGELTVDALHKVEQLVRPLLSKNNHIAVRRATIWAYSWLGQYPLDARKCARQILPSLYEQWKTAKLALDRRHAAWSFSNQPLLPRSSRPLGELTAEDEDFIEREWQAHTVGQWNREDRQPAAVLAAYYFGGPFSNADLRKKIGELNTGVLELRLRKRRL